MARSFPTRYRGIRFRSKLEADWARAFDALELRWMYEHEGAYHGDVYYMPGFYLPASRQIVEVKGAWTPDDCRKIAAYLHDIPPRPRARHLADIAVIAANPEGVFWGYRRPRRPIPDLADLLLEHNHAVDLRRCPECHDWWFHLPADAWRCQCCGASTPDGTPLGVDVLRSPIAPWPLSNALLAFEATA